MAHGGLHPPLGAEKSLNLLAFCGRFNDQEFCHRTGPAVLAARASRLVVLATLSVLAVLTATGFTGTASE